MRRASIFVVLLPFLAMVGWIAQHRLKNLPTELTLAVEGFDPRDLLSGHYIQYRVNYGDIANPCKDLPQTKASYDLTACVCFEDHPSAPARAVSSGPCEKNTCEVFIKGYCNEGRFEAGIEHFYLDEMKAKELFILPPNSYIKVNLDREGTARVRSLWPGGQELKNYKPVQPR